MNAQQVRDSAAFKKCADFHGHICPGMSIGFRAAQSAMQRLAEQRSQDEEIVAIVETFFGSGIDAECFGTESVASENRRSAEHRDLFGVHRFILHGKVGCRNSSAEARAVSLPVLSRLLSS